MPSIDAIMHGRIGRWALWGLIGVVVAIPVGVALTFLSFEVTSQPAFCGSCHIMKPYYESWRGSKHNGIACVECHIPPGITSELRKKYEALSMVVRYFTGTYSTNPWTEVDDQSCLRSGCHAKRILLGRELYSGVLFDHQPHLTAMRRGKQLRCTSCHSQIVQGSHIAVTPSTCFLCHFKNTPLNTGTARCTLCHAIPEKTITTAGLSFDHGDVKRFGMECLGCHEEVVRGNGEVPRERCFTCHNDTSRLNRYGETEFLHRMHVTDHKVECLNCHIEIRHGVPPREELLTGACETCHSAAAGHSTVRDLYRGLGGRGVDPRPATMYLAGVRCEACHNRQRGENRVADEISCMSCHGPAYLTMFRSWQAGLRQRLEGVRGELRDAEARLEARGGDGTARFANAKANLALVEHGKPVHNPGYALDLIRSVHREVSEGLSAAGEQPPAAPPWTEAPYQAECLTCHFGVELLTSKAFGKDFPHTPHVMAARLRCPACHADAVPFGEPRHGALKITAASCGQCHDRIKRPMSDVAPEDCLTCHTAAIGPVSEQVTFPHEKHIESGVDCTMCHQGVGDLPHRAFARSPGAVPQLGHDFCRTCHSSDVPAEDGSAADDAKCNVCHVNF